MFDIEEKPLYNYDEVREAYWKGYNEGSEDTQKRCIKSLNNVLLKIVGDEVKKE